MILSHERFIKTDLNNNNNKFWYVTRDDSNSLLVEWGRVGYNSQSKEFQFRNESEALKGYETRVKKKIKEGYVKLNVVESSSNQFPTAPKKDILTLAQEQIQTPDDSVRELIKLFVQENVHNILSKTTLKYNEVTGVFSTPCGVVNLESLSEARSLLTDISLMLSKKILAGTFSDKVEKYLTLIPKNIGVKRLTAQDIFPDTKVVSEEFDLLDSLSASLLLINTKNVPQSSELTPKIFDVKMEVLKDKIEYQRITDYFNSTSKSMHSSYGLRIKNIYKIEHAAMIEAFKEGSKKGNIRELFHGSSVANILSILKIGLVVPKNYTNGRNFDSGVYASDISSKSAGYSTGFWNGKSETNYFMFLVDFAMGNCYKVKDGWDRGNFPRPGYDSTFAEGGVAGIQNNEMIVYSLNQIQVKYILELV